jgi:hypothetical protein
MNSKLTLNLNKSIIQKAKDYAKDREISLSKLIENYLNSLTGKSNKKTTITPLVKSLTGIIPEQSDEDSKSDYYDYLTKKYS